MATVCGSSLALMDAGVPIKSAVSGVAIGLVKGKKEKVLLTDIAGIEDHCGDMDFKVAGTRKGVTAIQMDLKINGLDIDTISKALDQAKVSRMNLLDKIYETIKAPREELSAFAPRIVNIKVQMDRIKDIIGPGGRMIKKIVRDTGASIDIDDKECEVKISSSSAESLKEAVDIIEKLIEEPEVGKVYAGRITKIMNFGAFCEILPGKEGLIHVSELSNKFVSKVEDVVKVGQEVQVKLMEIDQQRRLNLSIKQLMKDTGDEKDKDQGKAKPRRRRPPTT